MTPAASLWAALSIGFALVIGYGIGAVLPGRPVEVAMAAFALGIGWDAYGARLADRIVGREE